MSSLLEQRIQKKNDEQATAEEKVERMAAVKPSDDELTIVNNIINAMSQMFARRIADEGVTQDVQNAIGVQVDKEVNALDVDYEERSRIRRLVMTSMFGLGPLEPFMKPGSTATDIVVQRYDSICVEDSTGMHKVDAQFNSEQHLRNVIQRIVSAAGRQINLASPTVDAKLKDGSRVHATIPPISPDGATLTIRRFNTRKLEAEDYLATNTLNKDMLDFLKNAVLGKLNIIVCGGTGSGKTTLLNMLSGFIPENELIVRIQASAQQRLFEERYARSLRQLSACLKSGMSLPQAIQHRPRRIHRGIR